MGGEEGEDTADDGCSRWEGEGGGVTMGWGWRVSSMKQGGIHNERLREDVRGRRFHPDHTPAGTESSRQGQSLVQW